MTLFPIEHAHRLASPAEGEALFRGLRERVVSVRGYHTREAALIERLTTAFDVRREHTLSFEDGILARAALHALTHTSYGYLHVATADAIVRLWREREAWVHATGDPTVVERLLGRELPPGTHTVGDTTVTIATDDRRYPIGVRTPSRDTALALFHALASERLVRGHITIAGDDARAPLAAFVIACAAEAHLACELDRTAARQLTEAFAGFTCDWQASLVLVDFPDGRIHGFLKTPNTDERNQRRWRARIDKALRRAGLAAQDGSQARKDG